METDADGYFAKHDITSLVSDLLFELGFHRPKDAGKFMAAYVERRFRLADAGNSGSEKLANADGSDDGFSILQVHSPAIRPSSQAIMDDGVACSLLEEARGLRKKYQEFRPQPYNRDAGDLPSNTFRGLGEGELSSITIIPWKEFRADYERLLTIFSNSELWSFCERRLAHLRGLFDAHCALNAALEEAELRTHGTPERVDGCVQLTRSLSPIRLKALYQRKVRELSADAGIAPEVAPGKTLDNLIGELGRVPGPAELTTDVDAPQPSASTIAGVFSRTQNHIRGRFLGEAAHESFRLLEDSTAASGGRTHAEYRMPLHPETGAWVDLARWVAEHNIHSPRVRWVAQMSQAAYSELKARRLISSFGELLDNAFGPPAATLKAHLEHASKETEQLSQLLMDFSGFELAGIPGCNESSQQSDSNREPADWTMPFNPPYSYQLFHVWARLKALNLYRENVGFGPLSLRCSASNAEPLACAYLLGAASTSRSGSLAQHAPLQYLFALEHDALVVSVSLTSKRSLGGVGEEGLEVFQKLHRAGVALALCTEDATVSQQTDRPLNAEYSLAQKALGLSAADLAELARNSMVGWLGFQPGRKRDGVDGEDSSEQRRKSESEEGRTIRERYRSGRRAAELKLISHLAPFAIGRGEPEKPQTSGSFLIDSDKNLAATVDIDKPLRRGTVSGSLSQMGRSSSPGIDKQPPPRRGTLNTLTGSISSS